MIRAAAEPAVSTAVNKGGCHGSANQRVGVPCFLCMT
jgi:hypothetical protein